jgi:hypothetical protein
MLKTVSAFFWLMITWSTHTSITGTAGLQHAAVLMCTVGSVLAAKKHTSGVVWHRYGVFLPDLIPMFSCNVLMSDDEVASFPRGAWRVKQPIR